MIRNFQNKALEQLFNGNPKGIEGPLRLKVARILFALSNTADIKGMDVPGYRIHELKGQAGVWSVRVDKNWRITFRFENGNAYDVDFVDYH